LQNSIQFEKKNNPLRSTVNKGLTIPTGTLVGICVKEVKKDKKNSDKKRIIE